MYETLYHPQFINILLSVIESNLKTVQATDLKMHSINLKTKIAKSSLKNDQKQYKI